MSAELVVVGGGRMGEALVGGLLASGAARPATIAVVEADPRRRQQLGDPSGRLAGVAVVAEVADAAPAAGFGAVIAVKPGDVAAACGPLAAAGPGRVLSIAAGITLASLRHHFAAGAEGPGSPMAAGEGQAAGRTAGQGTGRRRPALLRAMPNTPALVGAGAAGLAWEDGAGDADVAWAEAILGGVGLVLRFEEDLLDAVTGLSGSGPAYVFVMAEALIEAGVLVGLPRSSARALTAQTLLGAARMLSEGDDGPEALRAAVTSPGGTTAAGLRALEAGGLRSTLMDAVVAATRRAAEIGG